MLLYHLQDLAKGHLLADFLHCNTDIVSCYVARVVCIELLEDGFELWIGEEVLNINSCRQKLAVIDHMVAREVRLINDFLDLLIIGAHSLANKDILQFFRADKAGTISINPLKRRSQFFNVIIWCHLHNQVQRGFLDRSNCLEISQAIDDITADANTFEQSWLICAEG